MREKIERPRRRVSARTLLLAGGAATIVATAIMLGGAGWVRPDGQQAPSPQAMDTLRDVAGDDVPSPDLLMRKPRVSSPSPTPASRALPHKNTDERDDGGGDAKRVDAVRNRAHVDEPRGRREPLRPPLLAEPVAERNDPLPRPRPVSPDTSRGDRGRSLIGMKCDELFPPHKREFRLRNIACHRLLAERARSRR